MNEKLANLGYLAIRKEPTPGTVAGIPNVFVPIYSEDLATNGQYVEDNPIMASKFFRYQILRGLRTHTGGFVCKAEPNTAGYVVDMLYTKGTTTGSDPYTHPYTLSATTRPNHYTVEIGLTNMAVRFMGYGASSVTPELEDGIWRFNVSGAALKSFTTRTVASVTGSGPYAITLTTEYSTKPTEGLFTGTPFRSTTSARPLTSRRPSPPSLTPRSPSARTSVPARAATS